MKGFVNHNNVGARCPILVLVAPRGVDVESTRAVIENGGVDAVICLQTDMEFRLLGFV